VIAVLAGASGCGLNDPDTRRIVGVIDAQLFGGTIQAPDTVQLGAAFTATVNTIGSSSCTRPDGVTLTLEPAEARVIPYDRIPADNDVACTLDLAPRPHPVELHFTAVGAATIVVEGMVNRESGERVRVTVTKAVVVVP
jgi:hypothetical protein